MESFLGSIKQFGVGRLAAMLGVGAGVVAVLVALVMFMGKEPSELLEPPTIDTLKEWASRAFTDPVGRRVELPALATAY